MPRPPGRHLFRETGLTPAQFLERHRVFRLERFAEAVASPDRSPATIRSLLRYHVKTGALRSLKRGLYARADFDLDPLLIAANVTSDAILAYDSALEFHGLGSTDSESESFLTAQRAQPFRFEGMVFAPVNPPATLEEGWGVSAGLEERQGERIWVTSIERTLVDCCDRPELGLRDPESPLFLGWFLEAFKTAKISYRKLVDYALLLGHKKTAARVGFLLEVRAPTDAFDELKALERLRPTSPTYFQPHRRNDPPGMYLHRWNLVVERELWVSLARRTP